MVWVKKSVPLANWILKQSVLVRICFQLSISLSSKVNIPDLFLLPHSIMRCVIGKHCQSQHCNPTQLPINKSSRKSLAYHLPCVFFYYLKSNEKTNVKYRTLEAKTEQHFFPEWFVILLLEHVANMHVISWMVCHIPLGTCGKHACNMCAELVEQRCFSLHMYRTILCIISELAVGLSPQQYMALSISVPCSNLVYLMLLF